MNSKDAFVDIRIPEKVLIELHAGDNEARDVIVQMEGGTIYTSVFVTLNYLKRQMTLTHDLCSQVPDTVPSRFAALEVPHIIVDSLEREDIEDTIDNLQAMEIFESVFTRVTESAEEIEATTTSNGNGRRATQEVAAVVLSDVLVVES